MILDEYEIPSTFYELGTHVSANYNYQNVADLQKLRRNHNALLAKRCRRTVLAQQYNDDDGVTALYFNFYQNLADGGESPIPMMSAIVGISPYTKRCELRFEAKRESVSGHQDVDGNSTTEVKVYPHLTPLGRPREIDTGVSISVSSTARADHSLEIEVPSTTIAPPRVGALDLFTFELYAECPLDYGNTPKALTTTVSKVFDWSTIEIDDASAMSPVLGSAAYVGDQIHFSTDLEIEPRTIMDMVETSTDIFMVRVNKPFNKLPQIGETVKIRETMGINFSTIMLYEKPTTDFFESTDGVE